MQTINISALIIALTILNGRAGILDNRTTMRFITAQIKMPYIIPVIILLPERIFILGNSQKKKIVNENAISNVK
jgi:hypothetical protein